MSAVELDRAFYASHGLQTVVADPAELSFEGGRLRAAETEIDLVQRVMLTGECLAKPNLEPLLEAVRADAVCLINPFRSELLGHKSILALLSDPEADFGLSRAEREAVRHQLPWTRQVVDGRTTDAGGDQVDLVHHLRGERAGWSWNPPQLRGHDVVLGWCAATQPGSGDRGRAGRRLRRPAPGRVQREKYPAMEAGIPMRTLYEDTDPFMYRGEFGGLLTRLSAQEITNVHADGSVCASLVIAPR